MILSKHQNIFMAAGLAVILFSPMSRRSDRAFSHFVGFFNALFVCASSIFEQNILIFLSDISALFVCSINVSELD